MFRGILTTIYVNVQKKINPRKIYNNLKKVYKNMQFIKFAKFNSPISTNDVANTNNCLISVNDVFLSLLLFPLMQEYFDPYIILFSLLIMNIKINFKFEKVLSVFLYLIVFLISTNLYYYIKFS